MGQQKIPSGRARNFRLKGHIEHVFGHNEFLKIKDSPDITLWRQAISKLFMSYKKAINDSIKVQPDVFTYETINYFKYVEKQLSIKSPNEEELFATTVSLQSELIFLLLGNISNCYYGDSRNLHQKWDLSSYRETQIIQTKQNVYNMIRASVEKKYNSDIILKFKQEQQKLRDNEDIYLWIFKNKMNCKLYEDDK